MVINNLRIFRVPCHFYEHSSYDVPFEIHKPPFNASIKALKFSKPLRVKEVKHCYFAAYSSCYSWKSEPIISSHSPTEVNTMDLDLVEQNCSHLLVSSVRQVGS